MNGKLYICANLTGGYLCTAVSFLGFVVTGEGVCETAKGTASCPI